MYPHSLAGIVSTAEALDRETVDKYMLTVRATDGGGRSCTISHCVNDNAPDAQVNTLLTRATAIDSDLGKTKGLSA